MLRCVVALREGETRRCYAKACILWWGNLKKSARKENAEKNAVEGNRNALRPKSGEFNHARCGGITLFVTSARIVKSEEIKIEGIRARSGPNMGRL